MEQNSEANRLGTFPLVCTHSARIGPKLSRPRVSSANLDRPRLTDLLDKGMRRQVTLVSAGSGWGKTTLVSAWAARQRFPVAWLTLDRDDNDPGVFSMHVLEALRAAASPVPCDVDVPISDGTTERIHALHRVLGQLPAPVVLVLDDVEVIDDLAGVGELSGLLRTPRDNLSIILISRSEPALPLHRRRAGGELSEIRASDLAFTAEEVAELLLGQELVLTPDEIALLVQRTEGWAVGLQLAAAFLGGPDGGSVADFAGHVRPVEDYLSEEVLAHQTPQYRRFLLYTSVCEQLCGDLADAITGDNVGQRTLEELEQLNQVFVRLDSRPSWFRCHRLVREVLQHRLALEDPGMIPRLHRRAADWYVRNDCVIDALEHAVAAQDWAYVGRLVVDAAPMILSRNRERLTKILEQVPAGEFAGTAELVVCGAILLYNAADYAGIRESLGEAQRLMTDRSDVDRQPVEIAIRALRGAVNRIDGDLPAVVDESTSQLTALTQAPLARLPSTLQYRAIALNNKGVALLWTEQPEVAERYLARGAAAARTAGVELVEINALGHLALLEVMFGSVREAQCLVRVALDKTQRGGWTNSLQVVAAHHAAALVELERGRPRHAERALQRGLRIHRSDPEAAQWKVSSGIAARLAIAQDRLPSARAFLEETHQTHYPHARMPVIDRWLLAVESEADLHSDRPDLVRRRYAAQDRCGALAPEERILLIRAALATGDLSGAQALLTEQGSLMSHTVATVEAGILGALVSEAAGRDRQAGEMLEKAIAMAALEGIRRPFLSLAGGQLGPLIVRESLATGDHAPFVGDLLRLIGVTIRTDATDTGITALSSRETEVLRYLPTMLTAAEIGEELGVSVNTIKAHVRAIYHKLGTPRRRLAVARAREHGLIR